MPERLILNVFLHNGVSHVCQGLWRRPEAEFQRRYTDLSTWLELARICERAKLDGLFFADSVGTGGNLDDDLAVSLREGMIPPLNDPFSLVSGMATVTEHLGFMMTSSIIQDHPFNFARKISTLDHLTKGRMGWNIVTSFTPGAWRNFGMELEDHESRYGWAEEYVDVVYKLWEGSWEDDAVVADVERGVWVDPTKVHKIRHRGDRYTVEGPHMVEPSPQRTPVLLQAGGSSQGRAFAARHAEMQFIGTPSLSATRRSIDDVRERARAAGRDGRDIAFVQSFSFVVGSTEEEAKRKDAELEADLNMEALAVNLSNHTGIDFRALSPSTPLSELRTEGIQSTLDSIIASFTDGYTPTLEEVILSRQRQLRVVGTPEQIADELEQWRDAGLAGINISLPTRPGSLLDFADQVIPVLQKRGLAQKEYTPGTLRRKLFGAGDRLPNDHPAAQYRRGSA
jgi:FMN-dependent oxidoreductase, nitrilotriacetate monooxygenase family